MDSEISAQERQQIAFYHPWPPIGGRLISGWLKTMLLFFDGAAILVAKGDQNLLYARQEETVGPLADAKLLHLLDPDDVINHEIAEALVEFTLKIATRSDLELLNSSKARGRLASKWARPQALSREERMATQVIWDEMHRRGLASNFGPNDEIFVEETAWREILAFLTLMLIPVGQARGLELHPATDSTHMIRDFRASILRMRAASVADIVTFDLEQVLLDLSNVGIADLLEFRRQHGAEYRRYAANLQRFAAELARLPAADRQRLFRDRRDELADEADTLKRVARTWWRRPLASVGLGMAGAAITAAKGDWPEAALALLAGIVGAAGRPRDIGAYSYLFRTQRQLSV